MHGRLCDRSKDKNGLIQTLDQAIDTDNLEHLQQRCNEYNKEHTIKNSTQEFLKIYKQVLKGKQPN